MQLRQYQQETITNTQKLFETNQSVLAVLATGTGKTVIAAHLLKDTPKRGIFLAHRGELLYQAQNTIGQVTGDFPDIEKASEYANKLYPNRFVCASVQTMMRGRYKDFNPNDFSLVVQDEAHHSTAPSFRLILNHFLQNHDCKLFGLTATPDRTDEEALGQVYDEYAIDYGILDAIDDGWLVPVVQRRVNILSLDISNVKTAMGDLSNAELAKEMEYEEPLHEVANAALQKCGDRKTLIFCVSVDQAKRLAEIINRPANKPDSAQWVCGKTNPDERKEMLAAYKNGNFQYLVNVGVCTEGFDIPGIQVVLMARPTKSRALYTQMFGRGTRPLESLAVALGQKYTIDERQALIAASAKPFLEVIDCVGISGNHKLISTLDILGGKYSDEVIELAGRSMEPGRPQEVIGALAKAEAEIAKRRRETLDKANRSSLTMRAALSMTDVDPFDTMGIVRCGIRAWDRDRFATAPQRQFLKSRGVDATDLNIRHASQLIDKLKKMEQGTMPFGKNGIKGMPITKVNSGYLNWCLGPKCKCASHDFKEEVRKVLAERKAG